MKLRLGLVACALVLALPASAYADSWSSPDPVGDATTTQYDPDPEPCGTVTETPTTEGDIQRLRVRHSRTQIAMSFDVTGLTKARRTSAVFTVVTPDRTWDVDVMRWRGRTEVNYVRPPDIDEDDVGECGTYSYVTIPRTCRGSAASIDVPAGRITVSLPRRCLRDPRWIRVGGQVYGGQGGPHGFSDLWLPRDFDGDYFQPLVGRRVYAGPRR